MESRRNKTTVNRIRRSSRSRSRTKQSWHVVNDPDPLVSIIIPAMNERRTIAGVMKEAARVHPSSEIIVVANGSVDGTAEIAGKHGARLLYYPYPLGHDVGRRVGAEAAKGRVLLFIDADMEIPARHLRPFVNAVLSGTDVALNDYSGPVDRKDAHPVVLAKHTLNALVSRPDLRGASLTAVPHALSRHAVEIIGYPALEIPPLAHAMAVTLGLVIKPVHPVPVGRLNASRPRIKGTDSLTSLVTGDHLEAVCWLVDKLGPRAGHDDMDRQRGRLR
ncbi:glycosyltransferase [Paenibacillus sp. YPG26]|uniref:glycosyltransferase family 2 protein n=1 Tax=Paenibacillus sp. YPG26 TaxID=2878915 RepID=UPI00203D75E6|nr:glycosyltransferase [Paenibacillus sp. YPG26]USB32495.1 glycosyltransferase [Paenibacillus sp. YPG26]